MAGFQDYCPIAAAVDVVGDRWTPLVLREVAVGSTSFNDIHRGIPRMRRSLLSQRRRELVRRGMLDKAEHGRGLSVEYTLTPAGQALVPILWELGMWASEWVFRDPAVEQVDASWLVWRLHQHVDPAKVPPGRTVVEFRLRGHGAGRAWLVLDDCDGSTACMVDPGYEVDLVVDADNREMHRWLLGRTPMRAAVAAGLVTFEGPSRLSRAFEGWFTPSEFAPVIAEVAHRERTAARSARA